MTQVKHIIQKLTVDVQTSSVSLGHEIRENARFFIDKHVIPLIESHLTKLQAELSENEILQLDRLTVDISTSPGQWNEDVTAFELQTVLERSLDETTNEIRVQRSMQKKAASAQTTLPKESLTGTVENLQINDRKEHLLDTWMNILESGIGSLSLHLQNRQSPADLEDELLSWVNATSQDKQLQLRKRLAGKTVQQRLINQHSQVFVIRLLETIWQSAGSFNSKIDPKTDLSVVLNKNFPVTLRRAFWSKVLEFIPFENRTVLADRKIASELFDWLMSSPLTNLTGGSDKMDWPVLLKRLSIQEKSSLYSQIKSSKLSGKEDRFVELGLLSVLTIEWLHRLTGKDESLSTYGSYLSTLLIPVLSNNSQVSQTSQTSTEEMTPGLSDQSTSKTSETNRETKKLFKEQDEALLKKAENEQIESLPPQSISENEEQLNAKLNDLSDQGISDTVAENQVVELPEDKSVFESSTETAPKTHSDETQENNTIVDSVESEVGVGKEQLNVSNNSALGQDEKRSQETAVKQKSLKDIQSRTMQKLQDDGGFLWVQNAGFILTHPFLKHLFSRTGILNEANELTDPVLAAHVLHFVASGIESDFEQEMVLEKILCGLAPEDSIPREVPISPEIRKEVDDFFEAIKSNWKPLSTSSNEAMRETFFLREGKLLMDESGLRLIVERKTVDILLNQLPWPLSIVRLPWLKDMIYIEWQ